MVDASPLRRLARLIGWRRVGLASGPARKGPPSDDDAKSSIASDATGDNPLVRGNAALARGELAAAEACYRQAVTNRDTAEANVNLGFVISLQGRNEEALAPLRRAFALSPANVDACYLLGSALLACGAAADAGSFLRRALELNPDLSVAYRDLARALHESGEHDAAIELLRQRIAAEPAFVDLHLAAGNILAFMNRLSDALTSYEAALALQPENAAVLTSMAPTLCALGQIDRGIACARAAVGVEPGSLVARSNLLLSLSSAPDGSVETYLAEATAFGRLAEANAARASIVQPQRSRSQTVGGRRLRVGFVSGDFRSHPVGYFLAPLLANWDAATMDALAYSNHPARDGQTKRLRSRVSVWRDVWSLDDFALARKIREDAIDVLIDLSGHTPGNRLSVFALRPAPIQASWLGYWASTGLRSMDIVLADETSVPPAHRDHFLEEIVYLPVTRLCFDSPGDDSHGPAPLPAATNGFLTFGSFQRLTKVNDAVIRLWSRVLKALPASRLRLQTAELSDESIARALLARFAANGVEQARIEVHGAMTRRDYLHAHAAVDVILDTFPHSGATTTCEALWMGVPTLTLAGRSLLSRQGASILNAAGMRRWIADDEDHFVARAVGWAEQVPELERLRGSLRESARASPLMDGKRFASCFQATLMQYAQRTQATGTPLSVSASQRSSRVSASI